MWRDKYSISDSEDAPFFIVGAGRSGNTLLRKMICENTLTAIPPELPGLGNIVRLYDRMRKCSWEDFCFNIIEEFKFQCEKTPGVVEEESRWDELGVRFSDIIERCKESESKSLASVVRALYKEYMEKNMPGSTKYGDKTPWNAFHVGRIDRMFPNAKYIHLIRDGRASALSYRESLNYNYQDAVDRWIDANKKIENFKAKRQDRFITIKYENLVSETDACLSVMVEFLELEETVPENRVNMNYGDMGAKHHRNAESGKIMEGRKDAWRKRITKEEMLYSEKRMGRLLKSYGYDVS
ncbi:sulfotransferase [Alcanivorax balearicus MACL04]|uniref:Sulfotransferase n=1 Tax=Alloalcanivorax balearicus MACL04 TaxID=1177182 RepID=A0ABT2R138_9GAMM|nr:sulfotransferase [Alloalcanivorax balearicus MACL04]